jgi:hypothetical protein
MNAAVLSRQNKQSTVDLENEKLSIVGLGRLSIIEVIRKYVLHYNTLFNKDTLGNRCGAVFRPAYVTVVN